LENGDRLIFTKDETSNMLVIFFNIIISIELIDTLLPRNHEEMDKVLLILLISLLALGRKFITVDYKHADPMLLIGLSAVTVALASAYYILKKSSQKKEKG